MVHNLVFRWPKPLFFMVLGAHGMYIHKTHIVYHMVVQVAVILHNIQPISLKYWKLGRSRFAMTVLHSRNLVLIIYRYLKIMGYFGVAILNWLVLNPHLVARLLITKSLQKIAEFRAHKLCSYVWRSQKGLVLGSTVIGSMVDITLWKTNMAMESTEIQ